MKILYSTIEYVPDLAEPENFAYVGFILNVPSKGVVKMETHLNKRLIEKVDPEADINFIKNYLVYMEKLFKKESRVMDLRGMTYNYVNQFRFKVDEFELDNEEEAE